MANSIGMTPPTSERLRVDHGAPSFTVETLAGGKLRVPTGRFHHLQFRRFAGCPICNLHLQTFARRMNDLSHAGVRTSAVFHSSLGELRGVNADLPFDLVGDPGRELYRRYGVESSLKAVLHPRAIWRGIQGVATSARPWTGSSDPLGLPADFLIDPAGTIVALKYGVHADDHWEVDEVIALAREHGGAQARAAATEASR
ncbi:MAG: AhpC/TSA family protein [Nannocystaceae bacterium]|nr:AhpC/TSA family protein [Nannocystaceae bacterium]